jgi:hypothetical protein
MVMGYYIISKLYISKVAISKVDISEADIACFLKLNGFTRPPIATFTCALGPGGMRINSEIGIPETRIYPVLCHQELPHLASH